MAPTAKQYGIGLATLAGIAALGGLGYKFVYGPQIAVERAEVGSTSVELPRTVTYHVSKTNAGDSVLKFCLDGDKNCVPRDEFVESLTKGLDAKLQEAEAKQK